MNAGVGTAAKAIQHPSFQLTGPARFGHGTSAGCVALARETGSTCM